MPVEKEPVNHMHASGGMAFPPMTGFAIHRGRGGWELLAADMYRDGADMEFGGWELVAPIRYCPWCGEELGR